MSSSVQTIPSRLIEGGNATGKEFNAALRTAADLWAEATTAPTTLRADEVQHDKRSAVLDFFKFIKKSPHDVKSTDVQAWRKHLESAGLKPATVYARISRLSSFYTWAMKNSQLAEAITANPVLLARPKAPRAYQGESTKSLTDEQLQNLVRVVKAKADAGSVVAKRDYALLLFYSVTGLRRSEVINLRGTQIKQEGDIFVLEGCVKGGDYREREMCDPDAQAALLDYLEAAGRRNALGSVRPIWTRHDRAGKSGAPLTSHAFDHNLKLYAREAGIEKMTIHMLRHTFGRMVADETGSLDEVQEALGHRNRATTRVYVQRITRKRDKHSRRISERLQKSA